MNPNDETETPTPTPRMDSIPQCGAFHHWRIEDVFAEGRKLERELSEANAKLHELSLGEDAKQVIDAWRERDGGGQRDGSLGHLQQRLQAFIESQRAASEKRETELAKQHDALVERSVGAMAIAEGDEGHEVIPRDCPMLVAVSNLRRDFDLLPRIEKKTIGEVLAEQALQPSTPPKG